MMKRSGSKARVKFKLLPDERDLQYMKCKVIALFKQSLKINNTQTVFKQSANNQAAEYAI